jgi:regulator of CtrA degradation
MASPLGAAPNDGFDAPVAFVGSTYEEAMGLLEEVRDFLAEGTHHHLPPAERLIVSYEAMRVTTRLVQVVAWLLARKAVMAGELDMISAQQHALSAAVLCRDPTGPDNPHLPTTLRALLEHSHRLYMRVVRLNDLARRTAA